MNLPVRYCLLPLALLLHAAAIAVPAPSTLSLDAHHAYAANAGWIDLRPAWPATGLAVGEYVLQGQVWAANLGWIDLGDGAPADGMQYGNATADDCGVNHDGRGNLSGYAYAANAGWISFSWAASTDSARPRVDLRTGEFLGYAYGANIGWIKLGGGFLRTLTLRITDSDGDGLSDEWERVYFGSLTKAGRTSDADHDGASDSDEYLGGTAPDDSRDRFKVLSSTMSGDHTLVTLAFTTDPTRHYRIETSTSLTPGSWSDSGLGTMVPDSGISTTRSFTVTAAERRFFRVVAVIPLRP